MNRTIVGLTTLLATMASTPLLAKIAEDTSSQRVSTAGIDLTSPAGQAIVHRRIGRAAAFICGPAEVRRLDESKAVNRCRKLAMADGENQLAVRVANAGSLHGSGIAVAMAKR